MADRARSEQEAVAVAPHAVRAWRELGHREPLRIEPLASSAKSNVVRMVVAEAEAAGGAVVAKRCEKDTGALECRIYREILPRLPVTALQYHGFVEERGGEFCWLFIEDAGDAEYSRHSESHRALAARWLATLHTSAAKLAAQALLPERDPSYYLDRLREGRDLIVRSLEDRGLDPDIAEFARALLERYDCVEGRWGEVEALSKDTPKTLVHGDFQDKNVRVRTTGGRPELLAFDWEFAGLGMPGSDLLNVDAAVYAAIVREHWPGLDDETLERVGAIGTLCRGVLAAIRWRAESLQAGWSRKSLAHMRVYDGRLREVMHVLGWEACASR